MLPPTVAIDLDGTLCAWPEKPAPDYAFAIGPWIEGAQEAVKALLERDIRVIVHTCRATWELGGRWPAVAHMLADAGFSPHLVTETVENGAQRPLWRPVDAALDEEPGRLPVGIWVGEGKPIAHLYIDDRGLHFGGDWDVTLMQALLAVEAVRAAA